MLGSVWRQLGVDSKGFFQWWGVDFWLIFGKENRSKMNIDSNLDWRSSREPLRDRFFRMSAAKCKVLRRFWRVLEASWEGFWRVLKASWGGFSTYFGIFFNYWFRNGFLYAFEMILDGFWYPLEKQKWAFHMEGIAKIKLSCCLNEVVWGSWGILIFDGLLINFWRFFDKFWLILVALGACLGSKIDPKSIPIACWKQMRGPN